MKLSNLLLLLTLVFGYSFSNNLDVNFYITKLYRFYFTILL
jgi:hypothetical protein